MRINCPSCQAKFNVKDELLGEKGRKIKCPKCAHVWHQMPASAEEPAATPAPPPAPEPAPSSGGGDVPMSGEPSGEAAPMETPDGGDVPMSSEPADEPSLEDIIGMSSGGGDVPMSAEPEATPEADKPRPDQDMDLPPDTGEIDELFADADKKKDEHQDVDDLLDDAEPEPIPQMFSGSPFARQAQKRSRLPIILGLPIVLLLGVLVAGYFLRGTIESMVPAAKPILAMYDMIPMGGGEVGEGLDIQTDDPQIDRSGEAPALVLRGSVVNATSAEKELPNFVLRTFDTSGQVLQEMIAAPPQQTITGGGKVTFVLRLENLVLNGIDRYTVDFTEKPVPGMAEGQ